MNAMQASSTNTKPLLTWNTAMPSPDSFGIGSTQGQRVAEVVAAIRAELASTPEALAMAKASARVVVSILLKLSSDRTCLDFMVGRPTAFQTLIERSLPADKPTVRIVEIAAGLSIRGLHMAKALPHAEIIEVDLPDMIAQKKIRCARAGIQIPANLTLKAADLSVTPLWEILDNQQADVITAEGLTQYCSPQDGERMAQNILRCLAPGGVYICDYSFEALFEYMTQTNSRATKFMIKQMGNLPGMLPHPEMAVNLMRRAGYEKVQYFRAPEVIASTGVTPKPMPELSVIFCSQKYKAG